MKMTTDMFLMDVQRQHTERLLRFMKNTATLYFQIRYDNGVEFAHHDLIASDTGIPVFFAYHALLMGTMY